MNYALIIILIIGVFILLSSFFYSETANLCYHRTLRKISQRPPIWTSTKIPLIDRVAGRVNLKIQQLDVIIETKTKDNVL
jgi:hypothetical protein